MRCRLLSLLLLCAACEPEPGDASSDTAFVDTAAPDVAEVGAPDAGGEEVTAEVGEADIEPPPVERFDPASASAFGYVPVTVDLTGLDVGASAVTDLRFGAARAIGLEVADATHVRALVQGGPGGAVEVVVSTEGAEITVPERFTYHAPDHPAFERVVAVGASLTQGVQRGTPSFHGGLFAPSAQLARQLGAYHPLPLLIEDLFPQLRVDQIGPAPGCHVPRFLDAVESSANDILGRITDEETGLPTYALARVDPGLEVWNIGVGGSNLDDLVHGPAAGDMEVNFLSHFVYEPWAQFLAPVSKSQMEMVHELQPTMIVVADMYGNDIISAVVSGDAINPGRMTPLEELQADLALALEGLDETGAEIFFANLPRASMLPAGPERRQAMIEAGTSPEEVDALFAEIDQRSIDVNATLAGLAESYQRVHVVDLFGFAEDLASDGLQLSDRTLTAARFGGLVSLDGVHFTDTGYAALANVFIETINEALGTDVPPIDVEAVHQGDYESLESFLSMGFDPRECDQPPPIPPLSDSP